MRKVLHDDTRRLLDIMADMDAPLHWTQTAALVSRPAWAEACELGLVRHILQETVLTVEGRRLAGVDRYTAHDPAAWPRDARERLYLQGYCHVMALGTHLSTGHPIVLLRDQKLRARDGTPAILHVFVQDTSGVVLDVDGRSTRSRVVKDTGARSPVFQTLAHSAELAPFVGSGRQLADYHPEDVACARAISLHLHASATREHERLQDAEAFPAGMKP